MNVNIDRIERYILHDYKKPKKSCFVEKQWLTAGYVCCFIGILFLVVPPYLYLSYMENIHIHHYFLLLLLIPIVAIVTIKICNRSMNNSKWDHELKNSDVGNWGGVAGLLGFILARGLPRNIFAMIILVGSAVLILVLASAACQKFHKVYLIRKYAPYFKDERLRSQATPTEPNL